MLTMVQHFKILALYRLQLLRPVLTSHQPPPTNQSGGVVPLSMSRAELPANKSSEMEYFLSIFQTVITRSNTVQILKSRVVLEVEFDEV